MAETGTVAFWHPDEGWGAVRCAHRPGVGFAHVSQIRGMEGYRELHDGEPVQFEWADDFGQDGCQWRVAWVEPTGRRHGVSPDSFDSCVWGNASDPLRSDGGPLLDFPWPDGV